MNNNEELRTVKNGLWLSEREECYKHIEELEKEKNQWEKNWSRLVNIWKSKAMNYHKALEEICQLAQQNHERRGSILRVATEALKDKA